MRKVCFDFFSCQNKSVVYKLKRIVLRFEEKKVILLKKTVLLLTNLNGNLL